MRFLLLISIQCQENSVLNFLNQIFLEIYKMNKKAIIYEITLFSWKKSVSWNFMSILKSVEKLLDRKKYLGSSLWRSTLRIQRCHCSGLGHCCGAGSIPDSGTSACCMCGKKKKRYLECHVLSEKVRSCFFCFLQHKS